MRRASPIAAFSLIAVSIVAVGCQGKAQPKTMPAPAAPKEQAQPAPTPAPKQEVTESFPTAPVQKTEVPESPSIDELNRRGVLKTIYFDYDSDALSDEARATLQANADWLKANRARNVMIGGHCDERGTIQYNIALGDRRANAVRDYLAGLGVDAAQLRAVSFGEEKPADPGHGEDAWKKNRRAEFTIES